MKEIIITKELNSLRIDKVCHKIFADVPNSFLYKMFRKKNIVLNGKKINGSEIVMLGDRITFFFSDESFDKLSQQKAVESTVSKGLDKTLILFENRDVLIYNKPIGVLSQPNGQDVSLIDLYEFDLKQQQTAVVSGTIDVSKMSVESDMNDMIHNVVQKTYGVCNRLDRNTTGISIIGKHAAVLKQLNGAIKDKLVDKYYHAIVSGVVTKPIHLEGYLSKDEKLNQVRILKQPAEGYDYIKTDIIPIDVSSSLKLSLVRVTLHTGKTHQIRAHLASIGHPILGDPKYGDQVINKRFNQHFCTKYQLLHSETYVFHALQPPYEYLNERAFCAPYFEDMHKAVTMIRSNP